MPVVTLHSPAKINLFLAVVGRRPDGFHDLVSLVAPLTLGDTLTVEDQDSGDLVLTCDDPTLPVDETNLVIRAARAYQEASGWSKGAVFRLQKRIPHGAGLGGGSSNATTTLLALNHLAGGLLSSADLLGLATRLGSDCALFLHGGPVVMRGRGEFIDPVSVETVGRLRGRRLWVFKPPFGIATPWAFRQLAALAPEGYMAPEEAEERLVGWMGAPSKPAEALRFNSLERVCFEKYLALPSLVTHLRDRFGLETSMSGSGSACFAWVPPGAGPELGQALLATVRETWGPQAFFEEVALA
ncbi:MAG: 4-(cytidine 5'-diphospho)-2-C-methyl-D-erythritol kinase [Opitutaceae bacterium]